MPVTGDVQEDALIFLAASVGVDDDNEPAPENDLRISNTSNNTT